MDFSGNELREFAMNSSVDTIELLGGFEQVDLARLGNSLLTDCQALLRLCIQHLSLRPDNLTMMKHYQQSLDSLRRLEWGPSAEAAVLLLAQDIANISQAIGLDPSLSQDLLTVCTFCKGNFGSIPT